MTRILLLISTFLPLIVPACCLAALQESPFACNRSALNGTARKHHFDELGPALRTRVKNVRELPDGYEFQFPADPETFRLAAEWIAGEHLCCPFFDIELKQERENGSLWIRLSGRPGVKQFIRADLGKWMSR
jgi:hypothetical protein